MIRALGSLLFYGRFLRSFSALGYRRRARDWPELRPDFSGQTWLVTGATGGIGRAVSLAAVEAGATVVAAARSEDKLETLRNDAADPDRVIPLRADLSLVAEVAALAGGDALAGKHVDVLVNNVGVLLDDFDATDEGFERSFATNLLGHWTLTTRLYDGDRLAEDGLVVEVSSGGMYGTALKLDPMDCDEADDYDGMAAYAMHKRAQVELTRYWNAQWQGGPIAHVMHPGWVDTEGVKTALPGFRAALKRILRTPEQGADTILWLAHEYPEAVDDGIWFDRALRPEHEFGFTKKTRHDADELALFLEERVRRV
ncbi:MAG: SDR family NAD(P)-dependent oxidoreductase [Candidatus Wenzhouxiangella sp. M2_3B_020]